MCARKMIYINWFLALRFNSRYRVTIQNADSFILLLKQVMGAATDTCNQPTKHQHHEQRTQRIRRKRKSEQTKERTNALHQLMRERFVVGYCMASKATAACKHTYVYEHGTHV